MEAFHIPFIKLLQSTGYQVHAYAGPDHGKQGIKALGVVCHDVPFFRSALAPGNIKLLGTLISSFKKENFKLVHCNTPIASFLARIAAWRARVPVVIYTAHGFHFLRGGPISNWIVYYPLERIAARFTDYLITINEEDYQTALKFPVRKKVFYIPGIGLDTAQFREVNYLDRNPKRRELGLKADDFVVICIGELNKNKNQVQLIRAIEGLVKLGRPARCLLVGIGSSEQFLRKLVCAKGLEQHFSFLGFRRDIPQLLAAADAAALLSKREGLPKAVMEAMAAGKPVVATDVRGNRDLVIDKKTGFLVKIDDVKGTVQALVNLMEDQNLRLKMGEKAQEQVKQYDIANILRIMEGIYSEACKKTGFSK